MLSLPLGLILSGVGLFVDPATRWAKAGLGLGAANILVFFGLPMIASLIC